MGTKKRFMLFLQMFSDFRCILEIPLYAFDSANSIYVIFYVAKTFNAFNCKMCGKYTKNKSEIMKH